MNESATFSESDELNTDKPTTKPSEEAVEAAANNDVDEAGSTIKETAEFTPPFVEDVKETAEITPPFTEEPTETSPIIGPVTTDTLTHDPFIKAALRCDEGTRDRNEDSCLVFSSETGGHFKILPFGLYIVADGMGGHTNGHVASKIASRVAAKFIINKIYLPMLQSEGPPTQVPIQEVIVDAVQAANTAVFEDEPETDSGTTLTIALVLGRRLHVAHVGDSRLYLYTDDRFEAITNDHSLVQRLQDVGQLTPEEATIYRYRHVLLRAVGQGEEVEIDTYMRLLPKQGKLLLCSDGLCGFVADDVMQRVLAQDIPLQQMADELYDSAMEAQSNDNVTAILVDFAL
jgi:serine/threonine protein phosphatase PrpC